MKFVSIYAPYLYSIQYDEHEEDEFNRLFDLWNDVSYVIQFIETNKDYLDNPIWKHINEPESAAQQVLDEAERLEELFDELFENTKNNETPDFESYFHYLEGKYKYEIKLVPMKAYGVERPSLLRLYAIRFKANKFLITGGGIKLADTIQASPDLKDHVMQNIERVRQHLIQNGIEEPEDIINQST